MYIPARDDPISATARLNSAYDANEGKMPTYRMEATAAKGGKETPRVSRWIPYGTASEAAPTAKRTLSRVRW